MHRVGLFGASGYTGLETLRLLAAHPLVELAFASSDRWQGETIEAHTGLGPSLGELCFVDHATALSQVSGCAAVLVATPTSVAHSLVPTLLGHHVKVVDYSGAHRLVDSAAYAAVHGFTHERPDLLSQAVYGLSEWFAPRLREAALIANPGCYATAALLALAPLLRAKVIDPRSIVIDAASGTTGAGRTSGETFAFSEVAEDVRAYRLFRHAHAPEIAQVLESLGDLPTGDVDLVFTPHLLPLRRGILCTAHARLAPGVDPGLPQRVLREAYQGAAFVRVLASPEDVSLRSTIGTNRCDLACATGPRGHLTVVSALDNLIKGAAGQAVQNLNLCLGMPETLGLQSMRGGLA